MGEWNEAPAKFILLYFLDYSEIQASNFFFEGAGKGQVELTYLFWKTGVFFSTTQGKMQQVLSVIDPSHMSRMVSWKLSSFFQH